MLRLQEVNTKLLTVVRSFVRFMLSSKSSKGYSPLSLSYEFEAMREVSSEIDKQNLTTVHGILLRYLYVSVNTESYPP